jgi:hypothetical protein
MIFVYFHCQTSEFAVFELFSRCQLLYQRLLPMPLVIFTSIVDNVLLHPWLKDVIGVRYASQKMFINKKFNSFFFF